MIWRVFRRSPASAATNASWWEAADRLAETPDAAALTGLRAMTRADLPPDEVEQQEEMLDGLEALVTLASSNGLPRLDTQHRVIGADACHLMTPATLAAEHAVPGKLFLTDRRLVFAGGHARTWAWHRVRDVARKGRAVHVVVIGPAELVVLQCNSFGDAMIVRHLARRLTTRPGQGD